MASKKKQKKAKDKAKGASAQGGSVTEALRLAEGSVDLLGLDTRATPGIPGKDKTDAPGLTDALQPELSDLQERLYASGRVDPDARRVLLVLQGMDTSGKGGVIRHAIGLVDPQGVKIKAFRAPTKEELAHRFLWRITRELPPPGMIGIFDRSQYEDVLAVRVNKLATKAVWSRRFDQINAWEEKLVADGTVVIKCFLHISADEQRNRLLARLEDSTKHWKYNPGDVDERAKWPAYADAYTEVLERCNTAFAPWYVIPSDRKWYRNWAVAQLLAEQLRTLDLTWPEPGFDVEAEKDRVVHS